MRKLLWVGDAGVASGFARATHHTLEVLRRTWDVTVVGINYMGEPHQFPYPIYPAITGGDVFGVQRLLALAKSLKPDCVVLLNDVWNVPGYVTPLRQAGLDVPVVGWLAVDGKNCQGWKLNGLAMSVFWTRFAEHEAREGGYMGPSAVVPLGVNLDIYKPMDRAEIRAKMRVRPEAKASPRPDSFIIGNVNRNQQRKRFDLMVEYFCDWVELKKVDNAFLMLHACPTGDMVVDLEQLMEYRGMRDRLSLVVPNVWTGVPEHWLAVAYNMFDVMLNPSQGEGFGLTTFEAMACGVPQIVADWASLGELCEDAAIKIPCTSRAVNLDRENVIGGVMDHDLAIEAMDSLYHDSDLRHAYAMKGLALVNRPCYRWENVGLAFGAALDAALCAPGVSRELQEVAS